MIVDGRGMSDSKQGVTLEIFGEGWSMGPLNPTMKAQALKEQGDIKYPIEWNTLGEYLEYLERRGVTPNVASFVGATPVRMHELGEANRAPTAEELARMQDLAREFGTRPSACEETIEAILLERADAEALCVRAGDAALMVRRVTRDERGTVIEVERTIFRADRYRMVFFRQR